MGQLKIGGTVGRVVLSSFIPSGINMAQNRRFGEYGIPQTAPAECDASGPYEGVAAEGVTTSFSLQPY